MPGIFCTRGHASLTAVLLAIPAQTGPSTCVVTKCGEELAACLIDPVCRSWNVCNMACGMANLTCQMRCADLHKPTDATARRINDFSECVISKNQCVPQVKQQCKVPDNAGRDHAEFDMTMLVGTWYITRGWNPLFDCFDCQVHNFVLNASATKPLVGDLRYRVKKSLNCTYPDCKYLSREVHQSFAQDSANHGHLLNHNNSAAELHYADDWYVLAAKADVYVLVYYCGCNDAVCGYAGAVLYTRAPKLEFLSTTDVSDIQTAVTAAGVTGFEFGDLCAPINAACSNEVMIHI